MNPLNATRVGVGAKKKFLNIFLILIDNELFNLFVLFHQVLVLSMNIT